MEEIDREDWETISSIEEIDGESNSEIHRVDWETIFGIEEVETKVFVRATVNPFKSMPQKSTIPLKAVKCIDNNCYDVVCGYIKSIQKSTKLSIPIMVNHLILLFGFMDKAMYNIHSTLFRVNEDEQYKILQELMVILQSQSWDRAVIKCFDESFVKWLWLRLQNNYAQCNSDYIKILLLIICSLQKNQGVNILSTLQPYELLWAVLTRYIRNRIIKNCVLLIFSRMMPDDRGTQLHQMQKDKNISVYELFLNETTAIKDKFDEYGLQNLQSICHLMKYICLNHDNTMTDSCFKTTSAIIMNTINILHDNNMNDALFKNILLNIIEIIEMITDGGYHSLTNTFIHTLHKKHLLQVYIELTITATSSRIRYESIKLIYHVLCHQVDHKKKQIIEDLLDSGALDCIVDVMTQDNLGHDEIGDIFYDYELQQMHKDDFKIIDYDWDKLKQEEFSRVLSIIVSVLSSKQMNQINDKMMQIIIKQLQITEYPNIALALTCIEELLRRESFAKVLMRHKISDIIRLCMTNMNEHNKSVANKIIQKISNK